MKINKVIFVGNAVPEEMVKSSKVCNVNVADNIAQNTMIKGLHQYYGERLTVVSITSGGGPAELDLGYGVRASTISSVGFHRAAFYLSIAINYTKRLNELLRGGDNKDAIIITNGPYIYMALPAIIARYKYGIKWVPFLIGSIEIPDERFPYSLVSKLSRWAVKYADGAITYVASSATDYIPGKLFVEIFYLIDNKLMKIYRNHQPVKPEKFTITYTGALTNIYNVDIIIEAIKKTGQKYHWVFAGTGQYASKVKELSEDKKYDVDYLGAVSNVEAIKLQKSSHLLLCLKGGERSKINQYYSKYAASGKLIEYVSSGVPILAGDIPSFSDKVKRFMTCEKVQTVERVIKDIANIEKRYDEKVAQAKDGQKYAFRHFTADCQSKKIYDFLERL